MQGLPDIRQLQTRYESLSNQMRANDFFNDRRKAASISRDHQKLGDILKLYDALTYASQEIDNNQKLIEDSSNEADLIALAQEELESLIVQKEAYKQDILIAMLPTEEKDARNTIIEIRSGTGGDEASLFVAELFRMYTRCAERLGWRVEIMTMHPSECGGFKEVIFLVSGENVYKILKFESGVHRVQRVPATEANGRIHTSTVTVAILPEAEEVDMHINSNDLDITVCRASGPGGQGVNTTNSAVQILHKPSGMIVTCADERSQQKNKVKALTVLRSRLLKIKEEEEKAKYAATRRDQIGSGDRSERIRTYNFPQSRLTDHRINLSLHSLPQVMDGDIIELLEALDKADQANKLEEMLKSTEFKP